MSVEVKCGSLIVALRPYKQYQRTPRSVLQYSLNLRYFYIVSIPFLHSLFICGFFTTLLICDGYTESNGVIIREWWLVKDLALNRLDLINPFKNKFNVNYIKIHSVPRSKHTASGLQKPVKLMLYREIIAVYCDIHTERINELCGQNVGFLNVEPGGTQSTH
jgi:hypothetical protein